METWKKLLEDEMKIFNDSLENIVEKYNVDDSVLNSTTETKFYIKTKKRIYISVINEGQRWLTSFDIKTTMIK